MEKEGKVKITRNSASAKNSNDINIKVVVGEQAQKKRVYRKRAPRPAAAPAAIQNIVQLPPTEVAVPNVTFGRPQYNFTQPRPYDSPDAGGMRIATFPELMQNYQSRQEMMGMPQQEEDVPLQSAPVEAEAKAPAPEEPAMVTEEQPPVEIAPPPSAPEVINEPIPETEVPYIKRGRGRPKKLVAEAAKQMPPPRPPRSKGHEQALSALDRVISYVYDIPEPNKAVSKKILKELKKSIMPEGTTESDVWRQLGMMAQRMPPNAERNRILNMISGYIPSGSK